MEFLNYILAFLQSNAMQLLWLLFCCVCLYIIVKSEVGKKWLRDQFEWMKMFFAEDKVPSAPSHKNLIGVAMVLVFCIAFLKKVVGATDVPDIPSGWQLVILGILGIRALQSAAEKVAGAKYANGNGNGNGTTEPPRPPMQH